MSDELLTNAPNRIDRVTVANAAENERLAPVAKPPPFISPKLGAIAGLVAVVMAALSAVLAPPLGPLASVLGLIAAALAGMPFDPPGFVASKPLVGKTAVPILASAVPIAVAVHDSMADGFAKMCVMAGAYLLSALAGLASPKPKA